MSELIKLNYSVVIPTHNRIDFLENAIRSVFQQSILPYEIFVVDDLGLSKVRELLENLSSEFSFNIEYIISTSKNGVSHSYNLGASKAKGEYLAFLDDDDFWSKDYIFNVGKVILEKNIDIILTRLTAFNDESRLTSPGKCPPQKFDVNTFYIKNPGVLRSNLVIKRSYFKLVDGYDEIILGSSDKELFMRLKALGKKHYVIDQHNMVYWRTNHRSQASSNHKRMLGNVINFYKKYFFSIPLVVHLKMIIKISKLIYLTFRS